jgi:hypothetical protein
VEAEGCGGESEEEKEGEVGRMRDVYEVFGLLKKRKEQKKWFQYFPVEKERLAWQKVTQSADEAADWYEYGFTPNEALAWRRKGFTAEQAVMWADMAFSPSEAKKWFEVGVVYANDALQYEAVGLGQKDVELWLKVGITHPKEIVAWRELGVSPKQALRYVQRGFDPSDVELIRKKRLEKRKGKKGVQGEEEEVE